MAFPSILVLLATPPYLSVYISLPPFPGQLPSSCFSSLLFMLPVSYCSLCRDLNLPLSPQSPLTFLVSPGSTPPSKDLELWSTHERNHKVLVFLIPHCLIQYTTVLSHPFMKRSPAFGTCPCAELPRTPNSDSRSFLFFLWSGMLRSCS